MDRIIHNTLIAFILIFLAISTGCGPSNTVNLVYPTGEVVLPKPGDPSVAVVQFHDQRKIQSIGKRSNGSEFLPKTSLTEWVSKSLAEELAKQDLQVSYTSTLTQAKAAKSDYIVTGSVNEVWVVEENPASFTAVIRVKVTLSDSTGILYTETLTSSQEKQSIPTSSQVEELLSTTLQNLLEPAAKKLREKIH